MKNKGHCCYITFVILLAIFPAKAQISFTDTLATNQGDLIVHVLGHASVLFEYKGLAIYVDPYNTAYDYTDAVKADLIMITHSDKDHFDTLAIGKIKQPGTLMIYTQACAEKNSYIGMDTIMTNGDSLYVSDLMIHAVPAYNITKTKHPKGVGNGYVILFGDKSVYLSGDTEKIPEMDSLQNIDIAFLPLNQPYGMTPEMMAETVLLINSRVVIPYHYDDADITLLLELLKDIPDLEIWTGLTDIPSRITRPILNQVVSIFPNPVADVLYSKKFTLNSTAYVFDITGHLVVSSVIEANGSLDIHSLHKGQYIIHLIVNDSMASGKFLKL